MHDRGGDRPTIVVPFAGIGAPEPRPSVPNWAFKIHDRNCSLRQTRIGFCKIQNDACRLIFYSQLPMQLTKRAGIAAMSVLPGKGTNVLLLRSDAMSPALAV
jgi:hypothetical protein